VNLIFIHESWYVDRYIQPSKNFWKKYCTSYLITRSFRHTLVHFTLAYREKLNNNCTTGLLLHLWYMVSHKRIEEIFLIWLQFIWIWSPKAVMEIEKLCFNFPSLDCMWGSKSWNSSFNFYLQMLFLFFIDLQDTSCCQLSRSNFLC
jgi:hypothetical protein